jgi:hypothetical protein
MNFNWVHGILVFQALWFSVLWLVFIIRAVVQGGKSGKVYAYMMMISWAILFTIW